MSKSILLIHGRSWKPGKQALESIWKEALRSGVARDHPAKLAAFDSATIDFVYYGDLSNRLLRSQGKTPPPNDTQARKQVVQELKRLRANEFTKRNYNQVPGKESFKEGAADALAPLLGFLRLTDDLVESVAPDMREYWNHDSEFGSEVRYRMTPALTAAFDRNDSICIVAHSLGTMITYDTLWKFSRTGEYRPQYTSKKVDLLITTGSPLGDETVKRNLKGASASGARRYPSNIKHWLNVAAEDDYISHDGKIANDYKAMKRQGLVSSIRDKRIYNLSAPKSSKHPQGKSNPHHSSGYLIHPVVSQAVADWL